MLASPAFTVDQTHGILQRPGNTVRSSSNALGWRALYASAQRELPYEGQFAAVEDQLIVLHLDGPVAIDSLYGPHRVRSFVPAGSMHLIPGGTDFGVRLMGTLETMHVYVRRSIIEEVAAEMCVGDPASIRIAPQFLAHDPCLNVLMEAIRLALDDNAFGSVSYVDYLGRALAAQLVRHYSGKGARPAPALGSVGKMSPVVSEAVEYMRAHIDTPISLDDIACAVNRSASHLARQFRESLGVPPHQFLLTLRITPSTS
jgi:AraC family transcriptional regulator